MCHGVPEIVPGCCVMCHVITCHVSRVMCHGLTDWEIVPGCCGCFPRPSNHPPAAAELPLFNFFYYYLSLLIYHYSTWTESWARSRVSGLCTPRSWSSWSGWQTVWRMSDKELLLEQEPLLVWGIVKKNILWQGIKFPMTSGQEKGNSNIRNCSRFLYRMMICQFISEIHWGSD